MIDYKKKLTTHRELYPLKNIEISVESDRGRILSSGAFRRLQKRTQVFALELNASIRTRLTHSLEVAQTARFIAKTILSGLNIKQKEEYGLIGLEDSFISTCEMTSLLHDIGNPPFGHFAEQTINRWMHENLTEIFASIKVENKKNQKFQKKLINDLCNFDGNAQAIRIITKLQRLNLSYTQIHSVLKYTRVAHKKQPSKEMELSYLKKKPGFYFSEKEIVKKIQKTLEVDKGCRFPLTYIMEAADDISYLTADLEDAVEKGILNLDQLYLLIKKECLKLQDNYLLELIEDKYQKAKQNDEPYQFNMFFTLTRAQLVTSLVKHVSDIYLDNHEQIFYGKFNSALLEFEKNSKYYKAIKILQDISVNYIYENSSVEELDLQGYEIINGLLDSYKPLLNLSSVEFQQLLTGKRIECFISTRLIKRVSKKQIAAYKRDLELLDCDKNIFESVEKYYRTRLLIDFISGMTDDFALEEYRILKAIK